MKLDIITNEPKNIVIEFSEVDRSIAELIKDKLMSNKDVEFVGVVKEHPEISKPRLIVKSGKNAKTLIVNALEELQDEFKELASQLPKK